MPEIKKCETHLLEDAPALADAFGTPEKPGAHERVARAVVELIETTPGGKVIALEGGWGAGKSTVVGIIRGLFKQEQQKASNFVVSFDAWAHEGDPLRRTYLETLIRALQEEGWIDRDKWDKKLAEIANRRRVTDTQSTSATTPLGRWLALSVLVVPVGTVFMTAALRDGVSVDASQPIAWNFWFGLLTAAPLVVLLARLVYLILRRPIGVARGVSPESWAFLEGKTTSETRTVTTETPNPTSLEFADQFDELMGEALDGGAQRRVVLVLDNLDRVDPKDAIEIWSTLQTFLQHHRPRPESWFKRLWVLVPFDPLGFRRLWDNRGNPEQIDTSSKPSEPVAGLVSDSFFDKSFQVRFTVPPLVLSDWKNHLLELLTRALPNHSPEDRHAMYLVFDQFRPRPSEPPTPRELKLFVNQIGSIHRQWQDGFPLADVAYFVLKCRERQEFIEKLRSAKLPAADAVRMLGNDLRSNLAGLAFNVTADRGREILLTDPIYQALLNGGADELKDLAQKHQEGFWLTLEHVAQTKFFGVSGDSLAAIASTLQDTRLLASEPRHETGSVRRSLRIAAQAIDPGAWGSLDEALAKGFCALCRIENDVAFTRSMLKNVSTIVSGAAESVDEIVDTKGVAENLITILDTVEQLGHSNALPARIELKVDGEAWRVTCQVLQDRDKAGRYWARIRPSIAMHELLSIVQATITSGQYSEQYLPVIRVTYDSQLPGHWDNVVAAMRDRLRVERSATPPECVELVRALWELRQAGQAEAANALTWLVKSGTSMHHFNQTKARGAADQALWIYLFLSETPDGQKRGPIGNSEAGYQRFVQALAAADETLVLELARLTQQHAGCEWLFACYEAKGHHEPLLAACLRDVIRQDAEHRLIAGATVMSNWWILQAALAEGADEEDFVSFVGHMAHETDLCTRIQTDERGFAADAAGLYRVISAVPGDHIEAFAVWCAKGLGEQKKEAWLSDFEQGLECLKLLFGLLHRKVPVQLGVKFSDALERYAQLVIAEQRVLPAEVPTDWYDLAQSLQPDALKQEFLKHLLRHAIEHSGQLHKTFFVLFGRTLMDTDVLGSTDEVFSRLFSPWIKNRAPTYCIEWIRDVIQRVPEFWDRAKPSSAAEAFALRVREAVADPIDDEARPLIAEIAATLKLLPITPAAGDT